MYCSNCGNKSTTTDKFCSNCGTKLTSSTNNISKSNNNEIIALILGLISFAFLSFPPITIILAIISIIFSFKSKKITGNYPAGFILSIISLTLSTIEIIATVLLIIIYGGYTETDYQEIFFNNNDNYFEYNEDDFNDSKDSDTKSFDISGYSWIGTDNSILYLNHNQNYTWYQDDQIHDNNFHTGTYMVYTGNDAIQYIATNLTEYGITEETQWNIIENKNYEVNDYYLLILNCNKSIINNNEQKIENSQIYYYGFYDNATNQLDLINIATNTNAQFKLKEKIAQIDI